MLKNAILPALADHLVNRTLPSETIVKLTTIIIGTHWAARNAASLLPAGRPDPSSASGSVEARKHARVLEAEEASLSALLEVFVTLLSVGAGQVESVLSSDAFASAIADDDDIGGNDGAGAVEVQLHQHISAVLRRMLPSMRILSKWLKLHLDYISRFQLRDGTPVEAHSVSEVGGTIELFWTAYYRFIESLARAFPLGQLPMCDQPLEEDEDMRGYLPVARGFAHYENDKDGEMDDDGGALGGGDDKRRHPNEEQLMRIADLEIDATLVLQAQTQTQSQAQAQMQGHTLLGEGVTRGANHDEEGLSVELADVQLGQEGEWNEGQEGVGAIGVETETETGSGSAEDDQASVSTNTEDDPVNLAMRATLGSESESGTDGGDDEREREREREGYEGMDA